MSALDPAAILRALDELGAGRAGRLVDVVACTASTNEDARAAAAAGAVAGTAFLAEEQTAGRGRGGHRWHSPAGENIYLSLIARPRVPASSLSPVTLVVGAALAELLAEVIGHRAEVAIKWPNDVLAGGRKLAGVLVEGQLRGSEVQSVILGVGVNVKTTVFPAELVGRATSLALLGIERVDRSRLAAGMIAAIEGAIVRFEQSRLQSFAGVLARRDALLGRQVDVGETRGIAEGIDALGRLLVRGVSGEVTAVVSGEVLWSPG